MKTFVENCYLFNNKQKGSCELNYQLVVFKYEPLFCLNIVYIVEHVVKNIFIFSSICYSSLVLNNGCKCSICMELTIVKSLT